MKADKPGKKPSSSNKQPSVKARRREEEEIAAAIAASRAEAEAAEAGGCYDEGVAADLLRRSGRDTSHTKSDPSDTKLLREACAELRRVWNGVAPSGEWSLVQNPSDVTGLLIVKDFLNAAEVEALRSIFGSHRAWEQYAWHGNNGGSYGGLADVVQRIDFGPNDLRGDNTGSPMWRLGSLRAEMLSLLGERLRHVCEAAGLWSGTQPDTMQLTKMGPAQKLANHHDRRDRWQEGIASVVWSELPAESDLRGDEWTLVMEKGTKRETKTQVKLEMPPGCAYILTGAAQGATRVCERRCTGHKRCECCWTQGVRVSSGAIGARQSLTLRVLADSDDESSDDEDDEADDVEDEAKPAVAARPAPASAPAIKATVAKPQAAASVIVCADCGDPRPPTRGAKPRVWHCDRCK